MKAIKVRAKGPSLYFSLEDIEGQRMPRVFTVTSQRITVIPAHYAASLYNSPAIVKWIKEGRMIIVEGREKLEEKAIEESYLDEVIEPVNQNEMLNILKGNNLTKIKELFNGEFKELALELAGQNAGEISQNVLLYIEKETGISLLDD